MADIITIGRDPKSTICISDQFDTVSNEHAEIRQEGAEIIFTDHSSNGTLINGQKIQRRSVNIYRGDKIQLAGAYELTWGQIEQYLKPVGRPTVTRNIRGDGGNTPPPYQQQGAPAGNYQQPEVRSLAGGRETDMMAARRQPGGNDYSIPDNRPQPADNHSHRVSDTTPEIDKWNWGAFYFGWIWGVFNKVYISLIQLILSFIAFGLPFLGMGVIAPLFSVGALGVAVWLGVKGSRMAWDNGAYSDAGEFLKIRHNWNVAALVCFFASIFLTLIMLLLFMDIVTRAL